METIADAGTASCGRRQSENRALGLYQRRRPAEAVLYQLVQEHLETFLALSDDGKNEGLPGDVERDFRKYLDCGILARGFARARCKACGEDLLIAFSCKARGACPSCNTRRMVKIGAHLVDHVIPPVPVRQWMLSLPKRLRGFLHRDPAPAGGVLRIFLEEAERELRRQCPDAGANARTGAVVFPHRFRALLNSHYHFHACVNEGLCEAASEGARFHVAVRIAADDRGGLERLLRYFPPHLADGRLAPDVYAGTCTRHSFQDPEHVRMDETRQSHPQQWATAAVQSTQSARQAWD